jgi:hypothetical protein
MFTLVEVDDWLLASPWLLVLTSRVLVEPSGLVTVLCMEPFCGTSTSSPFMVTCVVALPVWPDVFDSMLVLLLADGAGSGVVVSCVILTSLLDDLVDSLLRGLLPPPPA